MQFYSNRLRNPSYIIITYPKRGIIHIVIKRIPPPTLGSDITDILRLYTTSHPPPIAAQWLSGDYRYFTLSRPSQPASLARYNVHRYCARCLLVLNPLAALLFHRTSLKVTGVDCYPHNIASALIIVYDSIHLPFVPRVPFVLVRISFFRFYPSTHPPVIGSEIFV